MKLNHLGAFQQEIVNIHPGLKRTDTSYRGRVNDQDITDKEKTNTKGSNLLLKKLSGT